MAQTIDLDVRSGYVSGFYFFTLELFMLAIVDIILIHLVSYLWYNRIVRGIPLEVKTAEIPGVATSLVGRFRAPPNLFAYFIKTFLLSIILLIDYNIGSKVIPQPLKNGQVNRTGTFDYIPSDEEWSDKRLSVTRPFIDIMDCRQVDVYNNSIFFHKLTFNFENDQVYESENSLTVRNIDENTIQCMKSGLVQNSQNYILAQVVNCSSLGNHTSCNDENIITRSYTLPSPLDNKQVNRDNIGLYSFSTLLFTTYYISNYSSSISTEIWPEYNNSTLVCLRKSFTVRQNSTIQNSCLVIAKSETNDTLIERWEYNETNSTFTRYFPGPIFKGDIDIGLAQQGYILRDEQSLFSGWEIFSARIISLGVVYRQSFDTIVKLGDPKSVTSIPVYIVVIFVLIIVTAIVSRIIIGFTIGGDERPRINTVDGLSSVAREENEPTGRSLLTGHGMLIGLSRSSQSDTAHFGPLRSNRDAISAKDVYNIS